MEGSLVVFLTGSAAAFLPIYWLLQKGVDLLAEHSLPWARSGRNASRNVFLQCLRSEAGSRARDELQLALNEMRRLARHRSYGAAPIATAEEARLRDVRGMLAPLLSRAELAAFDQIAQQLAVGQIRHIDQIAERIDGLCTRLESKNGARSADACWLLKVWRSVGVQWRQPALVRSC